MNAKMEKVLADFKAGTLRWPDGKKVSRIEDAVEIGVFASKRVAQWNAGNNA